MSGRGRGCAFGLLAILALLGAAYGGWRWGDHVFPRLDPRSEVESGAEAPPAASPELARAAVEKVEAARRAGDPVEVALGGGEVESVLRYAAPGVLPEGLSPPEVELREGRVHLAARVSVDAMPPVPELERVLGMLPDTVPVELDGSLMPFGEADAALVVHRIRASGIPLPRRLVPALLEALGREERAGLPPDAIVVALPEGIRSAYVRGDSLVLIAGPGRR